MKPFNRKDNDGHRFLIPEDQLAEFDRIFEQYSNSKPRSEEYYDLEAEFCNRFTDYMVG